MTTDDRQQLTDLSALPQPLGDRITILVGAVVTGNAAAHCKAMAQLRDAILAALAHASRWERPDGCRHPNTHDYVRQVRAELDAGRGLEETVRALVARVRAEGKEVFDGD